MWHRSKYDDPPMCAACVLCRNVQDAVQQCIESVSKQGHFRSSSLAVYEYNICVTYTTMIYSRIYQHNTLVNEKVDKVH